MWKGKKHTEKTKRKISEATSGAKHYMFGKHLSEEHKRKIGESQKGKIISLETRRKISIATKGKRRSEETKRKISKAHRNPSKETRRKMSEAHIGHKHTEESKRKLSEAGKGRVVSAKTRKKLSERQLGEKHHYWGKHLSKEHRRKIGEGLKGLFVGEKNPMYGRIGEKCHLWRGGKSFEPYTPEFNNNLKESIRRRDGYRCAKCFIHQDDIKARKVKGRALNIHHIDYLKKNCEPNNMISLCDSCHSKTNLNRKRWTKYFQERLKLTLY